MIKHDTTTCWESLPNYWVIHRFWMHLDWMIVNRTVTGSHVPHLHTYMCTYIYILNVYMYVYIYTVYMHHIRTQICWCFFGRITSLPFWRSWDDFWGQWFEFLQLSTVPDPLEVLNDEIWSTVDFYGLPVLMGSEYYVLSGKLTIWNSII